MFWLRLALAAVLGFIAVLVTHPFHSFPNPGAYFADLSGNTGNIVFWVFGLFGLTSIIADQIEKWKKGKG
jgi:hypothetical protein